MTEDAEFAKLLAYFRLLSDDHKQEIIKRAENLVSAQKAPEKETKEKANDRTRVSRVSMEGFKGRQVLP
jgi:hypothetical protein